MPGYPVEDTTTQNALGFLGGLHLFGQRSNTLLRMVGGLGVGENDAPAVSVGPGFREVTQREFTTNVDWELPSPSQPARKEADVAPDARTYKPAQEKNVIQIFEETVDVSYLAQSERARMSSSGVLTAFGENEFNQFGRFGNQLAGALGKIAQDFNYSALRGSYSNPGDPTSTALGMRGLLNAVTTNVNDATGNQLSDKLLGELYRAMIDRSGVQPEEGLLVLTNTAQLARISEIYKGEIQTTERRVGGNIVRQIYTAFGVLNLPGAGYEMDMPQDELLFVNPSVISGAYLPVPNPSGGMRPALFMENLTNEKSADRARIYGQLSFDYGPEWAHAKLTNLSLNGS